jgi:heme O synthase-like polyprenyltransferase
MDAYLILKNLEKNKKNVEKLNESTQSKGVDSIGLLISIIIGAYAAFLSYECNSKKDVPESHKIFFAVLAYLFGLFYLVYYFLFRYDTCL